MPFRVLLYSDDAANSHALTYFQNKHYEATRLTDHPRVFWAGVDSVNEGGYLALLSHGNEHSPAMIGGEVAPDMTEEEIAALMVKLVQKSITFYCFSCHTGSGGFATALRDSQLTYWVAPVGYAVIAADSFRTGIHSQDRYGRTAGWAGPLAVRQHESGRPVRDATSFDVE